MPDMIRTVPNIVNIQMFDTVDTMYKNNSVEFSYNLCAIHPHIQGTHLNCFIKLKLALFVVNELKTEWLYVQIFTQVLCDHRQH